MKDRIYVHAHARKHGLVDAEIAYAWEHCVASAVRVETHSEVRIGFTRFGKEVELLGARVDDGWLVFHAMSPVTKKVSREIATARSRQWRVIS